MSDLLGLSLVAKATLVLLLALGTVTAMRRARAARRALVLAAAFAVLLGLPAASLVAPPVAVGVLPLAATIRPSLDRTPALMLSGDTVPPAAPARAADAPATLVSEMQQQHAPMGDIPTLVRALWAAGVVLVLVPFLAALWRVRGLARTALPWSEGARLAGQVCTESGIRRHIDVGMHEQVRAPMTFGLLRPTILMPCDAPRWDEADLRHALVHELEHVRRLDWLVYLVARTACALYWCHPLVWVAWRRLCLDTERACDDAVLRGNDADGYARQLVSLAQRLSAASRPLVGMASRSDLSARVRAILNLHQTRGRAGVHVLAGVAGAACLLLAVVGPLQATPPIEVAEHAPAIPVQPARRAIADVPALSAAPIPASQVRVPGAVPASVVASIRRSTSLSRTAPGHGGGIERLADGRIVATGVTIFDLVRYAYGLDSRQPIAGAREWTEQRFDMEVAHAPGMAVSPRRSVPPRLERDPSGYTVQHAPLDSSHWMIQALLEERFQLDLRFATYRFPQYRVGSW